MCYNGIKVCVAASPRPLPGAARTPAETKTKGKHMTTQTQGQGPTTTTAPRARTTDETVRAYLDTLPHDRQRAEADRLTTERSRDLLWHRKPTLDAAGKPTGRTNAETLEAAVRRHEAARARKAKAQAQAQA